MRVPYARRVPRPVSYAERADPIPRRYHARVEYALGGAIALSLVGLVALSANMLVRHRRHPDTVRVANRTPPPRPVVRRSPPAFVPRANPVFPQLPRRAEPEFVGPPEPPPPVERFAWEDGWEKGDGRDLPPVVRKAGPVNRPSGANRYVLRPPPGGIPLAKTSAGLECWADAERRGNAAVLARMVAAQQVYVATEPTPVVLRDRSPVACYVTVEGGKLDGRTLAVGPSWVGWR